MSVHTPSRRLMLGALLGSAVALPAWAQEEDGSRGAASGGGSGKSLGGEPKYELPPFPPPASAKQSIRIGARTLNYTATVGALPVRNEFGKVIAEVVYTAYLADTPDRIARPVTFAFNGGPGAASVYLNLGAIGPKRIQFGAEGDAPSDPVRLLDNQGTWLEFTDLVFIDPVGTGFSRALVPEAEAKRRFYAVKPDIDYLSRIVFDWLNKNGRFASPKYIVGESYGGFRGPRLTHTLQTDLGVGISGLVLVSPLLDDASRTNGDISPLPWVVTLTSIAAANLERQHRLTDQAMAEVIAYARGDYVADLLRGRSDPAAVGRIVQRVTALTGLDPAFVKRAGGRLETQAYLREVFRDAGKLGSRYDSNVTSYDPFPFDPEQRVNDPILESIVAPTTSAIVDFDTRIVGWKVDQRYEALSSTVGRMWDRGRGDLQSVTDLRQAVAVDPKMRVLIVHGWNDLSCPFMASVLIADQMPQMGAPDRVQVKMYPGGHMFYSRPDSSAALKRDVARIYGAG